MSTVNSLSEAFYNSIIYFLRNDSNLSTHFSNRVYLENPNLNLTVLTLPFLTVKDYLNSEDTFAAPEVSGYENKLVTFHFSIGVYCSTYAEQRYLPELVRTGINKSTVNGVPGIQIYKGWTDDDPDTGSEIYVAEIETGDITPLGGETEEDVTRKFRSFLDCTSSVMKDFSKIFIT